MEGNRRTGDKEQWNEHLPALIVPISINLGHCFRANGIPVRVLFLRKLASGLPRLGTEDDVPAVRNRLRSSLLGGNPGTLGGGWLGDYLIQRGVTTTVSRKSIIGAGLAASTVLVVGAAYVGQTWLAVTLLTLCVGSLRLATGSVNSLPIDLAPREAVGWLTAIQNFFGNVGGLLAPIITGWLVSRTGSFVISLVVAGGMALFGAISYLFIMGNLEKPIHQD